MNLQRYRELSKQIETDPEYWKDIAVSDFAREITQLMRKLDVNNAELARRMKVERQYVTKLLSGTNATLGSMVKVAMALDAVVRVHLETREDRERTVEEARYAEDAKDGAVILYMTRHPRFPTVAVSTHGETAVEAKMWNARW